MKEKSLLNSSFSRAAAKAFTIIIVLLCPCIAVADSNARFAWHLAVLTKKGAPESCELVASLVMQDLINKGYSFVERQDLEAIIDEQMRAALFEKPLAIGKLLNADFLLLFEEAKGSNGKGIRFRMIEVKTGTRWLDDVFELEENNLENTANRLADLLYSFVSQKGKNVKYYASVTPFENHTTDYELDSKMLGLTRLLEMIVVQRDDMVLLEHEDARLLLQEDAISPLKLVPNSSALILSGTLNRTQPDERGNTLRQLTLQISSPGKASEKWEITLDSLLNADPVEILYTCLKESQLICVKQPAPAFNFKEESTLLLKRADELFNLGQYSAASESYAALIMQGLKSKHIYHSLIMSYVQESKAIARENTSFSGSRYNSMLKQIDLFQMIVSTLDEAYSVKYYDRGDPYELRWALNAVWSLLEDEVHTIVSSRSRHCPRFTPEQLYHYRQLEQKALLRVDELARRILEKEDLWYLSRKTADYIRESIDRGQQPDNTLRNRKRLEEARRILDSNPTNANTICDALRLIRADLSRAEREELESWNNIYVDLYVNYQHYCHLKDNEKALPLAMAIKCRDAWKRIATSSSPEFLSKFANNLSEDVAIKMAFDADVIRLKLGHKGEAIGEIMRILECFPVTDAKEILIPIGIVVDYYLDKAQPQRAVDVLENYYKKLLKTRGTRPGGSPRMLREIGRRVHTIHNNHGDTISTFAKQGVLFKKIQQLETIWETRFPGDIYAFNGKIYPHGTRVLITAKQHMYLTKDGCTFTALTSEASDALRSSWLSDVCIENDSIWAVYGNRRLEQWSWEGKLLKPFSLMDWLPANIEKICITSHNGKIVIAFGCYAKHTPGRYTGTVGIFFPESKEFKVFLECRKKKDGESGIPQAGFRPIEFLHLPGSDEIFLRTNTGVIKLNWPTKTFRYVPIEPWYYGRATFYNSIPWFIIKNYGISGYLQSANVINGDIYLVGDALVVLHDGREEGKFVTYNLPEALQYIGNTHYGLWALDMQAGLYEVTWLRNQAK